MTYVREACPIDFAMRLDELFESCVEGGDNPEDLKAYLIQFISEIPSGEPQ